MRLPLATDNTEDLAEGPPRRRAGEVPLTLRRVLLRSVGPSDARFDPLTLDMSADEPVTRALWALTNTGGKTTLLRLIYSVLVTRASAQMGGANIGDFVGPGDTAHVVLEWEGQTGRFVTGAVYEWPGRTPTAKASMGELNRWYYTYRLEPAGAVAAESLPFATETSSKATLSQFRAAVQEIFRSRPMAMFNGTEHHGEWRDTLETTTPLDPTLFQYQMRMNSDEGGADALVEQLTTPDAFVRFFVQALNEDAKLQEFTKGIAEYAERAGLRRHMEREATLCAELASALEMLDLALRAARAADESRRLADVKGGELAASIRGRTAQLKAEIVAAIDAALVAENELSALTTDINRNEDIRSQLLYLQAQFRTATARQAHDEATADLERTTADFAAWSAVPKVIDLEVAKEEAAAAKDAYEIAEADLAPLRQKVDRAAGRLAAAYGALANRADKEAKTAAAANKQATKDRARAQGKERDARKEAADAAQTESRLRGVIADAETELTSLRERGVVEDGERIEEAAERTMLVAAGAQERVRTATANRESARKARSGYNHDLDETRTKRDVARTALEAAEETGRRNLEELSEVNYNEILTSVAGGDVENARHAHRLVAAVDDRAEAARNALRLSHTELDRVVRQLDALDRDDLLEPHTDITRVLRVLRDGSISATAGWTWIKENVADPSARRGFVESHPELAGGVVVSAGNLTNARAVLTRAGLNPLLAIAVIDVASTEQLLSQPPSDNGSRFVVDPHPALYDPARARDLQADLRREQVALEATLADQDELARATGRAQTLLDGLTRRWADDFDEVHATKLQEATASLEAAQEALSNAERHAADLDTAVTSAEEAHDAAIEARETTRTTAAEVARIVPRAQAAVAAQARLAQVVEAKSAAESEEKKQHQRVQEADARRDTTAEDKTRAEGRAQDLRRQQYEVGVEPADEPGTEPLDAQVGALRELRRGLNERENGSNHSTRLDQANERVAGCRVLVDATDRAAVEGARERLRQLDSTDKHTTSLRIDSCDKRRVAAARAQEATANSLAAAEKDERERAPAGRTVHAVLAPEWEPNDEAQAEAYRAKVDVLLAGLRAKSAEQGAMKARLDDMVRDLKVLDAQFDTAAQRWTGTEVVPEGSVTVFDGDPDAARAAVDDARNLLTQRTDEHHKAEREVSDTFDLMRGAVRDQRWDGVSSTVKETCDKAPRDVVTEHTADWARALRIRERSLVDDLRDLDQYRENIVVTLQQLTSEQLRLLNQIGNFSKLPSTAGPLAGNPAIRIRYEKLSPPEARGRLAELVDDWAVTLAARERKVLDADTRVKWLCDAVKRTVKPRADGDAWKVEVLKPTVDGALIYRTPDRIREFSGGQELTLAILVYITLAGVRAANRIGGRRPPVPLLSDNPFGKASNEALIRTQHALAQAADVQLICASGIDHPDVLAAFEGPDAVIIRLRNDRAQRTGMRHLRIVDPDVAEHVLAKVIGGHDVSDTAGYVSGTSYKVAT